MREHILEAQRFQIEPENMPTFLGEPYSYDLWLHWLYPDALSDFQELAKSRGFVRADIELPSKRGSWSVYERDPAKISNFGLEDTLVHSSLAIYAPDKFPERGMALLRSSEQELGFGEFTRDLETFNRTRIDVPFYSFYPHNSESDFNKLVPMIAAGIPLGLAAVYAIDPSARIDAYMAGLGAGTLAPVFIFFRMQEAAKKRRESQISNYADYFINENASGVLQHEKRHMARVSLQNNLYDAISDEQPGITHEQIISIFEQLPQQNIRRFLAGQEGDRTALVEIGKRIAYLGNTS